MSYLINQNGKAIAETQTILKSGAVVSAAYEKTEQCIDANRDFELVGAFDLTVSNAKKYKKSNIETSAIAINGSLEEFHLA